MKWYWLLILFLFLALFQLLQIVDLNRSMKGFVSIQTTDLSAEKNVGTRNGG